MHNHKTNQLSNCQIFVFICFINIIKSWLKNNLFQPHTYINTNKLNLHPIITNPRLNDLSILTIKAKFPANSNNHRKIDNLIINQEYLHPINPRLIAVLIYFNVVKMYPTNRKWLSIVKSPKKHRTKFNHIWVPSEWKIVKISLSTYSTTI